jgi:hypothetical protein
VVNDEASNTSEAIENLVNDEAYDFLMNLTPAKVDNVFVNAHLQGYTDGKEREMLATLSVVENIGDMIQSESIILGIIKFSSFDSIK